MMTHAFQEIYLSKAQSVLGDIFDYAINICNFSGKNFINMFVTSSASIKLENGEPKYIAGKSGIEILEEIIEETKGIKKEINPQERFDRSKEYWIGWVICYYQWYSSRSYRQIFKAVSYNDLDMMYAIYHESDISNFVDTLDSLMQRLYPETNLKLIRKTYGLSQSELAKRSGVSLRSIQMYEQRNKDINMASASTLYKLSKVLGCTMEALIEH